MAYSGKFQPKNPSKYHGDVNNIVWRSLWELKVMQWLDENPNVSSYSSEEFFIPYLCKAEGKYRRYFIDFKITFSSGKTIIVEVKPDKEIAKPKVTKKITPRLMKEIATYAKNASKWEAAEAYAQKHNYSFMIWGETALNSLGIKVGGNVKKGLR